MLMSQKKSEDQCLRVTPINMLRSKKVLQPFAGQIKRMDGFTHLSIKT